MADAGMHVPAIEDKPSTLGYEWLWEAFWALNSERQISFSIGPIPWSSIEMYANAEHLNFEEKELLHFVIRKLDDIFMSHLSDK